jgi:hypothetical protein
MSKEQNTSQTTEPAIAVDTVLGNVLYLPELVMSWKSLNVDNFGVKLPITTYPGMGKYWIPVFESIEECKKEYPDSKVIIIKQGQW